MYPILLGVHNVTRWLVIVAAVFALARARRGVSLRTSFGPLDRRALAAFVGSIHLQLVLGLALYLTSPAIAQARAMGKAAMQDRATRFLLVEHPFTMLLAAIVATVGSVMAKQEAPDATRFRRMAIAVALTLGLVLAMIPWGRPLLPGF